jgi:SAM-dependent methyltransferase
MPNQQRFWDQEYKRPKHLSLSDDPADDLEKFTRWLDRNDGKHVLYPGNTVLDLGCGNGRNLIYLAKKFRVKGIGYDLSETAVAQSKSKAQEEGLELDFYKRNIVGDLGIPDRSVMLVLDMMTSHYLSAEERKVLRDEIERVLEPGGFLFFKSFLAEGDLHAERLLKEHPGKEPFTYIHPKIGVQEYVWTEDRLRKFFEGPFIVRKIYKSHKHLSHGKAFRRRTISAYLEKPWEMAR